MRRGVLLAGCALCMTALTATADLQGQPDLHRLQGTWLVTRVEQAGGPDNDMAGGMLKIASDIFYLRTAAGGEFRGIVQLSPAEVPKRIDVVLSTGAVWQGNYAIENGILRLTFATTGNGTETLIELRKSTSDNKDKPRSH
jgi:uncharacterized protein (TIGR03067 family)